MASKNSLNDCRIVNAKVGKGRVPLDFLKLSNVELPDRNKTRVSGRGGRPRNDHFDDVIRSLDTVFTGMSFSSACAAKDAAGARCNARGATERARRYSTRSFPTATTTTTPTDGTTGCTSMIQPRPTTATTMQKQTSTTTVPTTAEEPVPDPSVHLTSGTSRRRKPLRLLRRVQRRTRKPRANGR